MLLIYNSKWIHCAPIQPCKLSTRSSLYICRKMVSIQPNLIYISCAFHEEYCIYLTPFMLFLFSFKLCYIIVHYMRAFSHDHKTSHIHRDQVTSLFSIIKQSSQSVVTEDSFIQQTISGLKGKTSWEAHYLGLLFSSSCFKPFRLTKTQMNNASTKVITDIKYDKQN